MGTYEHYALIKLGENSQKKIGERKVAWVSWEVMIRPRFMGGLGFRDLELFNLALVAREAWRVLQGPSSLSVGILKSVYFPHTNILEASLGSHPSQIWRSILEGRDVLAQGLIHRIGDGESTHMWRHNWLPRAACMRPITTPPVDGPIFVQELIDVTSASWKEDLVRNTFLPFDASIILSIPLCTRRV